MLDIPLRIDDDRHDLGIETGGKRMRPLGLVDIGGE